MYPYVSLSLTIASTFLFFCYFVISRSNYYERFSTKYDVRNMFPFELNYKGKFKDNLIGNLFLILYAACSLANYVSFDTTRSGLMIFVMVAGILANGMLVVANFVSLNSLRAHICTAVFLFITAFLNPSSIAIAGYNIYKSFNVGLGLATLIVGLVFAVFAFILIMNPNLTHWAEAKKVPQEDGTIKYVRPKFFVLAFSEWLLMFTILASQIVLTMLTFSAAM